MAPRWSTSKAQRVARIVFVESHRTHIVFVERAERALPAAPPLSLTGASRLLTLVETSVGAATPRRLEPGMCCALPGAIIVVKYRTFETCDM